MLKILKTFIFENVKLGFTYEGPGKVKLPIDLLRLNMNETANQKLVLHLVLSGNY